MVNNAGTEGTPGPLSEQTAENFAAMFDTNVLGSFFGMKHALRVMQAQSNGSIVNISSTMGERGAANMALYAASKHAVEGLTKSAAIEAAAFGVRVNAVAPGPIETEMLDRLTGSPDKKQSFYSAIPMKRGGQPEEVAEAIVFVASQKAQLYHRPDHSRQWWQDCELGLQLSSRLDLWAPAMMTTLHEGLSKVLRQVRTRSLLVIRMYASCIGITPRHLSPHRRGAKRCVRGRPPLWRGAGEVLAPAER